MEAFETRRKFCRITIIAMIAVALLYCLVYIIFVKSTDILADSLGGVQSVEANNMALQWVFKQSQGFKAWTIVLCVVEVVGLCCLIYCYLEGIYTPKRKRTPQVNTETISAKDVCEKECDAGLGATSVVATEIPDEGQMSDKEPQNELEPSIESEVIKFIEGYHDKKVVIPYVYKCLTDNGSINGVSQGAFISFVRKNANIKISKSHMSRTLSDLNFNLTEAKQNSIAKEYERVSTYLATLLKKNQSFDIKKNVNKSE